MNEKEKKNPIKYIFGIIITISIIAILIFIFKRISEQRSSHEKEMYNVENISKFSNIKQQEKQNWSTQSEYQIVNNIKKDDRESYEQLDHYCNQWQERYGNILDKYLKLSDKYFELLEKYKNNEKTN